MSTKYSLEQIRSTLYSGLICDVLDQMGYHHQYLGCEMDALLPDTVVFGKAFTAVALKMSTEDLAPLAQPGGSLYGIQHSNGGRIVIFGGGVPLIMDGRIVGGFGVSGGTAAQDTAFGRYAKALFEKELR